jgi:serine/threonine protein kinase
MESIQALQNEIINFIRSHPYKLIKELGQGACGKTVLLYDDQIEENFVCKKYVPFDESQRQTLFANFVREIKLLHKLSHPNVVRVFNYYLYPAQFAGFILMEFVDGMDIGQYMLWSPEQINDLFLQAISGFSHLEEAGILHRDIRPQNLMVSHTGQLKIIDLGFGKSVKTSVDFEKSISLNWWCAPPEEFGEGRYDFSTEVYFVGKLFERLLSENDITDFRYSDTLREMCFHETHFRIGTFAEIEKRIRTNQFSEVGFTPDQLATYRAFAEALASHISKIESDSGYITDLSKIETSLGELYRNIMLEEYVPNARLVINCFLSGTYYFKTSGFATEDVLAFVKLLKTSTSEQKKIILANLHTKLDAIVRYDHNEISDSDIPF